MYSIPDASVLSGVSAGRIRRWVQGYSYQSEGTRHDLPPVWQGDIPAVNNRIALSFRDLIEMRFVDAFVQLGVSWKTIRFTQEKARDLLGLKHPFCTNRFRTDGDELVVEMMESTGQANLFELESRQQVFAETTAPLHEELDFDDRDGVIRWWPMGREMSVVLDPRRSFGRPVTDADGIPTAVLFGAHLQGYGAREIADWYECREEHVLDAVRFEEMCRS